MSRFQRRYWQHLHPLPSRPPNQAEKKQGVTIESISNFTSFSSSSTTAGSLLCSPFSLPAEAVEAVDNTESVEPDCTAVFRAPIRGGTDGLSLDDGPVEAEERGDVTELLVLVAKP